MAHPIEDFASNPAFNDFRVPIVPDLSGFIQQRGLMKGVQSYSEALKQWRADLERMLVERIKGLEAATVQSDDEVTAEDVAASVETQITALTNQINVLSGQINGLLANLNAHIAATVVHGTESDVVGETDEQALEAKTIGVSVPRNAKVRAFATTNVIPAGVAWTINVQENWVTTGTFTINGTLTINGYFLNL